VTVRHSQRGVALVTAMLVVAIIGTVAAFLGLSQQVWLRQTQNLMDLAQADHLRLGALRFAAIALTEDAKHTKVDDLTEDWAKGLPPLPVEGGYVVIQAQDAAARFNLNSVVDGDAPNAAASGAFKNLLTANGLDPNLVDALVDWIDGNSGTQAAGAEDVDYLSTEHPYRAANRPLITADELRMVKGFTDEVVEKLKPHVIALPEKTAINWNTASDAVLAAVFNIPESQAAEIVRQREGKPFTDKAQIQPLLPKNAQNLPPYDVQTAYFIVTVETHIGRTLRRTEALLKRPPGGQGRATVLWQRQPPFRLIKHEDSA
jgi:general secretion pathway protein K